MHHTSTYPFHTMLFKGIVALDVFCPFDNAQKSDLESEFFCFGKK